MKINFGQTLQTVIDRNNLTQKQAANALHITPQTLNSYIKNRRVPDMETMRHILQHFQLDANIVLQIKLDKPREYVTSMEQNLLYLYRSIDYDKQKFVFLLMEIVAEYNLE